MAKITFLIISIILTKALVVLNSKCPVISSCSKTPDEANNACVITTNIGTPEAPELKFDFSVCKNNEICGLDQNTFTQSGSTKCVASQIRTLPGESCETNSQCFEITKEDGSKLQECNINTKTCVGLPDGATTTSSENCDISLVNVDGKCIKQASLDASCKNSYDCQNNLLCHENKCISLFSLDNDADVSSVEKEFSSLACKSFYVHENKCATITYSSDFKSLADKDGIVKCDYQTKCKYLVNTTIEKEMDCSCGYNTSGQGYCPIPFNDDSTTTRVNTIKDLAIKTREEKNHTLNRSKSKDPVSRACLTYYTMEQMVGADECVQNTILNAICKSDPVPVPPPKNFCDQDGNFKCNEEETCCSVKNPTTEEDKYVCYPLKNANCCVSSEDFTLSFACPEKSSCNNEKMSCDAPSF